MWLAVRAASRVIAFVLPMVPFAGLGTHEWRDAVKHFMGGTSVCSWHLSYPEPAGACPCARAVLRTEASEWREDFAFALEAVGRRMPNGSLP